MRLRRLLNYVRRNSGKALRGKHLTRGAIVWRDALAHSVYSHAISRDEPSMSSMRARALFTLK